MQPCTVNLHLCRIGTRELPVNEHVRDELTAHDASHAYPDVTLEDKGIRKVALAEPHEGVVRIDEVGLHR